MIRGIFLYRHTDWNVEPWVITLGNNVIIGVVSKDIPNNSIVVRVSARVIKLPKNIWGELKKKSIFKKYLK